MTFNIPDKVLNETTKCTNKFECIKSSNPGYPGNHKTCEVEYADGKNVLFLKEKDTATCPYRLSFAFSQVCTCPVHFEIYKQHELNKKNNNLKP
jgi:hypothetical protein